MRARLGLSALALLFASPALACGGTSIGAGAGGGPHVRLLADPTLATVADITTGFSSRVGGSNVAFGTLAGRCGSASSAGAGGGPHVRLYDAGGAQTGSFLAFDVGFTSGVSLAIGGGNLVAATESDGGTIKVFSGDGSTVLANFFAFAPGYTGGVHVATGLSNGQGVIVAAASAGPRVRVFDAASLAVVGDFFGLSQGATISSVTTGRFDQHDAIFVGTSASGLVNVFDTVGFAQIGSFLLEGLGSGEALAGGRFDGHDSLFVAYGSTDSTVRIFDTATATLAPLAVFSAAELSTGGVNIAADAVTASPPVAAVPEPAIWLQLLIGFGVAGSAVRSVRSRGASRDGAPASAAGAAGRRR